MQPKLDIDTLNTFLRSAFPTSDGLPHVLTIEPGVVMVEHAWTERMLRPGGVISGPTMMSLADTAAYALVLAHVGVQPMAVTSGLTINFLRGCKPGTLTARGELLKLGRRLAVCDVRIWTEGPERPAAQASVTYALPGE